MGERMIPLSGNTYPVKEELKKLGARWDGDAKFWSVPESNLDKAKALIEGAAKARTATYSKPRAPRQSYSGGLCSHCGDDCGGPPCGYGMS